MPQQSWVARLGLESPGHCAPPRVASRAHAGWREGPLLCPALSFSPSTATECPPDFGSDPSAGPHLHQACLCLSSRCVLGNTTILAEFASEEEISRFFAQSQSLTPSPSWQSLGSSQSRLGALACCHSFSSPSIFSSPHLRFQLPVSASIHPSFNNLCLPSL